MDFQDLAANEASSLVARLVARRREQSLRDLQSVRTALDSFESSLNAPPDADDAHEVAALVDRLAAAVADEAERLRSAADEESDRLRAAAAEELERVSGEAAAETERRVASALAEALTDADHRIASALADASDEADRRVAAARADASAAADARVAATLVEADRQMAAAFAEAETTANRLRAEHAAALDATKAALAADHERALGDSLAKVAALEAEFKDQADRAYAQLVERSDKLSAAEAALRDARDTSDAATLERAELKRELRELRGGWDAARGEMDSARLALDSARAESQALREELARAEQRVRSLENEKAAGADMATVLAAVGPASPGPAADSLERLLTGFDNIDRGTTFDDVLVALAGALKADFPRVAVFTIASNKLRGTHQDGFEEDISKVLSPVSANPSFVHALTVDRAEAPAGAPGTDALRKQFGGSPEAALILPVKIHGEPLAVIYADTEGREEGAPAPTVDFAELIRRHAAPRLEQLRADLKVIAELRAYAMLLIDEVEYMHAADVSAGKKENEIRQGLDTNVQCAKQMFAQRAGQEGPIAALLLEEQLAAVAADKSTTRFGKDLAKLEAASSAKN